MINKISTHKCPICRKMMFIIGSDDKNRKLTSCGCRFKFKKTKSEKDMDRQFIETPYGLERIK